MKKAETKEEWIAVIKTYTGHSRENLSDEKYQVDVPDWLLEELVDFLLANGSAADLPEDLVKKAAEAGVAIWSNGLGDLRFFKKFKPTDSVSKLLDLESVGMQDVKDLHTIQDLVDLIGTFPGILPYIHLDETYAFSELYVDLQAQGFAPRV